jgi:hypothetical protein
MNILSKVTIPHGMWHITCMKYKSIYSHTHTHTHTSDNNNTYTTNWENIRSQAFLLITKIDINVWMDKFPNANIGFPS